MLTGGWGKFDSTFGGRTVRPRHCPADLIQTIQSGSFQIA